MIINVAAGWVRTEIKKTDKFGLFLVDALLALSNPPPSYRRISDLLERGLPTSPPQRRQKLRQVQTRLTSDQLAQLLERYRKGERAYRLAVAFKIDRRTVANILVRAGVRRPRSMTPEERAEAVLRYADGWSCERIGKHLGRSPGTVWRTLRAAGVDIRDASGY